MPFFLKNALLGFALSISFSTASMMHAATVQASQWQGPLNGIDNALLKPHYQSLHTSALSLADQGKQLCLNPTAAELDKTRLAFKQNLLDWQAVQWLNYGPVTYFMRYYAIEFWPDKKGLTARQLKQLVNNEQSSSDQAFWKSASIAVRGLTAMENILYRASFNPIEHANYCQLLVNISQHHASSTQDIAVNWQQNEASSWVFVEEDSSADPHQVALELIIQQWLEHMSMVKESKIETPIGFHGKAKPKMAEFTLSNSSLSAIRKNLTLYPEIYHAGQPSLYDLAMQHNKQQAQVLETALNENIRLAAQLPEDVFASDLTKEQRIAHFKPLISAISSSQSQVLELVTQLGFEIGFNSRDGD